MTADVRSHEISEMSKLAREARGDILAMTTLAGSGHPGGSLSSIDIFLALWSFANISPAMLDDPGRDRIVVSHGHTAPAVYAVLGRLGYFDPQQAICTFRTAGSPFEGHADPKVPGVEMACGNLGQGLSAACGFALATRLTNAPYNVFFVMGDGEQQKGQIAEARRFAVKHSLNNLVGVIDCNGLQAMGSVEETMPQNLEAEWKASGWRTLHVDGHNYADLYCTFYQSVSSDDRPTVILAHTTMGKGVSFIEDKFEYHGKVLTRKQCEDALRELEVSDKRLYALQDTPVALLPGQKHIENRVNASEPRTYEAPVDCRSAWGNALADIATANVDLPVAVFDCDLSASVKTEAFKHIRPQGFIQCGIQEHSAATIAGSTSKCGVLSFLADFGVFGIDETYNQHRLNDINKASLKLILTHCGLDVGEDGKTHQCIDYISLASNLMDCKLIVPADANQMDRAVRYVSSMPGMFIVATGRSTMPIVCDDKQSPLFSGDYAFEYGRADWIRQGDDGTIVTVGNLVGRALEAHDVLLRRGFRIGVLNVSCPLELDKASIGVAARTGLIVTYEDHNVRNGLGSIVGSYLAEERSGCAFLRLGVTRYGISATPDENYRLQGLDVESLTEAILKQLSEL